jgi:hypothetical protein
MVALSHVQDESGRVRAEDYVAVLAALTGEAALVAALGLDIETSSFAPGAALFGDQINAILTGDATDYSSLPPDTVVGIVVGQLVPGTVPVAVFPPLDELYRHVAATVGKSSWGNVTTSVRDENKPSELPLRAAFELRGSVIAAQSSAGLPRGQRHIVCALALAIGLQRVKSACDMKMAVTLAMEIVFGMAKMAPLSQAIFTKAAREAPTSETC